FDQVIRQAGSKPVLYETFARREGDPDNVPGDSYTSMQYRITEAYRQIANELHAELVPVGSAWQRALRERPNLRLWAGDGLHPSIAGSYLAACTFYAHFYQRSPLGNPYLAGLDAADALVLQGYAAAEVLAPKPLGAGEMLTAQALPGPSEAAAP